MDMKELRKQSGLKAEEVAVKINVSVSTVRNWEQGRTSPTLSVEQFVLLCQLYQCDINKLHQASKQSELEFEMRKSNPKRKVG